MTAQVQHLLTSKNSVTALQTAPEIPQFYAVNFKFPKIYMFGLACKHA